MNFHCSYYQAHAPLKLWIVLKIKNGLAFSAIPQQWDGTGIEHPSSWHWPTFPALFGRTARGVNVVKNGSALLLFIHFMTRYNTNRYKLLKITKIYERNRDRGASYVTVRIRWKCFVTARHFKIDSEFSRRKINIQTYTHARKHSQVPQRTYRISPNHTTPHICL